MRTFIILILCTLMVSCASSSYITKEEDYCTTPKWSSENIISVSALGLGAAGLFIAIPYLGKLNN